MVAVAAEETAVVVAADAGNFDLIMKVAGRQILVSATNWQHCQNIVAVAAGFRFARGEGITPYNI